jgi:hypothetical protein
MNTHICPRITPHREHLGDRLMGSAHQIDPQQRRIGKVFGRDTVDSVLTWLDADGSAQDREARVSLT